MAADPAGARGGRHRRFPRRGLPDLRRGCPTGGGPTAGGRRPRCAGPADGRHDAEAAVAQQPEQPDRAGARHRRTSPRWSPGRASTASSWPATSATPSSTGDPTASATARSPTHAEHPRPAGLRRQPRGPARRLLAEQAVQPRRLPGGLRRRRRGPRATAARGAQARRDDRAVAGAAGPHGRPRRRRPRGRAEGPVRRAARHAAGCRRGVRAAGRPLRRGPLPLGDAGRGRLGDRRRGWPRAAYSWRPAASTAKPVASTCGSPSPPPTSASPRRPSVSRASRADSLRPVVLG